MAQLNLYSEKATIDSLFTDALAFRGSEEYIKFFRFIEKFQHYSHYNTMLVYLQNPEVTFFSGKSYWKKKFSREINPGGKPLLILAPGGPIMLVYDVYDTIGKLGPEEFLDSEHGRKLFDVEGKFEPCVLEALTQEAKRYGIDTEVKTFSYFKAGNITAYRAGSVSVPEFRRFGSRVNL